MCCPLNTMGALDQTEADQMRALIRPVRRPWATARVNGILPVSGTRVLASYVWTPAGTLGPTHSYLTQRWQPQIWLSRGRAHRAWASIRYLVCPLCLCRIHMPGATKRSTLIISPDKTQQ